jgi:hypothetical protein
MLSRYTSVVVIGSTGMRSPYDSDSRQTKMASGRIAPKQAAADASFIEVENDHVRPIFLSIRIKLSTVNYTVKLIVKTASNIGRECMRFDWTKLKLR